MEEHLNIGGMVFPRMDQMDFPGPSEVLSRIPNSVVSRVVEKQVPVQDAHGLTLAPTRPLQRVHVWICWLCRGLRTRSFDE
jgi:cyclohexyl-isocyanide hydratase